MVPIAARVCAAISCGLIGSPSGCSRADASVSLPVSKATIASRLSLTPEYFSRVLHELEAAGLVRIDKREIHILDAHALANYRSP